MGGTEGGCGLWIVAKGFLISEGIVLEVFGEFWQGCNNCGFVFVYIYENMVKTECCAV